MAADAGIAVAAVAVMGADAGLGASGGGEALRAESSGTGAACGAELSASDRPAAAAAMPAAVRPPASSTRRLRSVASRDKRQSSTVPSVSTAPVRSPAMNHEVALMKCAPIHTRSAATAATESAVAVRRQASPVGNT